MNRLMIAFAAAVLLLSACTKEQAESSYTQIDVADLPSTVTTNIAENYPDAEIVSAVQVSSSDASYFLLLSTNEDLACDAYGEIIGYAASFRGGRGPRGGGGHGPGGGHGGGHHGGVPPGIIPVDSLPLAIVNYVSSTFPTDSIIGARLDSTCQYGKGISVLVSSTSSRPKKLFFDLNNTFLYSAERVAFTTASQAVQDTIASTYPTYRIRRAAERLVMANAAVEYNVFLNLNRARLVVTVQEDGTIVCTK